MRNKTSSRLIIFEGPDGVGKTTLAQQLANDIGAWYVHLGAFSKFPDGPHLSRMFLEAMMPAILGHSDVVMDRCWVSDVPYGIAYRKGLDRVGLRSRLLERLAWRCRTTFVHCNADWAVVRAGFAARKEQELLDNDDQLRIVYDWYEKFKTDLPTIKIRPLGYSVSEASQHLQDEIAINASIPHKLDARTAGNILGKVLIVGDEFGDIAPGDPLYQSPFGSFVGSGCSLWLADQLEMADIPESKLMWVNSDQLTPAIKRLPVPIVALGKDASDRLTAFGRGSHAVVNHPQRHKRFFYHDDYALIDVVKAIINQEFVR